MSDMYTYLMELQIQLNQSLATLNYCVHFCGDSPLFWVWGRSAPSLTQKSHSRNQDDTECLCTWLSISGFTISSPIDQPRAPFKVTWLSAHHLLVTTPHLLLRLLVAYHQWQRLLRAPSQLAFLTHCFICAVLISIISNTINIHLLQSKSPVCYKQTTFFSQTFPLFWGGFGVH